MAATELELWFNTFDLVTTRRIPLLEINNADSYNRWLRSGYFTYNRYCKSDSQILASALEKIRSEVPRHFELVLQTVLSFWRC